MKHQFINANKIIEAMIVEPRINDEVLDSCPTRGWQVWLIVGYQSDGYPNKIVIDYESEQMCLNACNEFGLRFIF